jgi:hypothetical protein
MYRMTNKKIKFLDWDCLLTLGRYPNNRLALDLVSDDELHEPVARCTSNIPDMDLADDEVAIKDYSENEGMFECLYKHHIIQLPTREVQSGFVTLPVCKLTDEAKALISAK